MSIAPVSTRLSLGSLAFSLGLLLTACSDTSMSGNSGAATTKAAAPTAPASANAAANPGAAVSPTGSALGTASDGTATSLDAANGGGSGSNDAANGGSGSNSAAVGGPMTITKTIGGIALEDKGATVTVTRINPDGSAGPSTSVTYGAGASGVQQLGNLCESGGPTTVSMKVSVAGVANTATTGSGTSTVSFDPSTCALSNLLTGGKGDSFALSCGDEPVVVK